MAMADKRELEYSLSSESMKSSSGAICAKDSQDGTTSSSGGGSGSPRLPISTRLFGRSRSTSVPKDIAQADSDEHSESRSSSQMELSHSMESEKESKKKEKDTKSSWQFFGTPKSKGSGSWFPLPFAFIMKHSEKNNEIHKIFTQLPRQEKLIDDFSCALQRDILIHGRLYLTQNWICFYANIFSWETLLTIPLLTVTSITKEKTALLIPNAILINTTVDKYGFSSFMNRDVTYNIIFKLWQNSLLDQPLTPLELVKAARKAAGDSTDIGTEEDLWGPFHDSETEESKSGCPTRPSMEGSPTMPTHVEIGQISATTSSHSASGTTQTDGAKLQRSLSATVPSGNKQVGFDPVPPPPAAAAAAAGTSASAPSTLRGLASRSPPILVSPVVGAVDNNSSNSEDASTIKAKIKPSKKSTMPFDNLKNTTADAGEEEQEQQERSSIGAESYLGSSEFETFSILDETGDISCNCPDHTGRTIINDVYNADVESVFQFLFTDSDFFRSFLRSRKTTNLETSEWSSQPDGSRLRDLQYTLALNYSFGPKYSPSTEHQIYHKTGQPGLRHIVTTEVVNGNIPYGDAFYVSCRYCLTRVAHNKTRVRITSNICFRKNCWGLVKNLIERNAGDGIRSYYSHLDTSLKEYISSLPAKGLHRNSRRVRRVRQRRQPSLSKVHAVHLDEEKEPLEGSPVINRRASVSSKHSIRSSDQKASEDDAQSLLETSSQLERKKYNIPRTSIPRINIILTLLLGFLIVSNLFLYYQLMGYYSSQASTFSHQGVPQPTPIFHWPTSQEEWVSLVSQQLDAHEAERQQWTKTLQQLMSLLKQMEQTTVSVQKILSVHLSTLSSGLATTSSSSYQAADPAGQCSTEETCTHAMPNS